MTFMLMLLFRNSAVDELLPKAILDATQVIFNMVGAIIVTVIVNPLFLAPVAVLSTIFMFIRQAYLRTSRDIKRLEGNGTFAFSARP